METTDMFNSSNLPAARPSEEEFWNLLLIHQNQPFHTAKNLPFTYTIRGGEMFVDRRSKSITKATILQAYRRILEDQEQLIRGPKKLNCFGAPYVWAVFLELGVVSAPPKKKKAGKEPAAISEEERKEAEGQAAE